MSNGRIVGVTGGGVQLADAAEDMHPHIPDALEQAARLRAATLFQECARIAADMPWMEGAIKKWMMEDEFEQCIQTNQGVFRVVIRRG